MPTDSARPAEFERALVEHLRITASVAKIASQSLLKEIKLKGALELVRLQFADVRLGTIELNPPFFEAMLNRNRLDLTLEAFALRAEWQPLFSERKLQVARKRLKKYGYDSESRGRLAARGLQPPPPTRCLLTMAAKLDYFSTMNETLPHQLRQLEDSLAAGSWGYPNAEHRAFLEDATEGVLEFPHAVRQYRIFDVHFFETITGLSSALETALDLSDERVQRFLLHDPTCHFNFELFSRPFDQRSSDDAEIEEYKFAVQATRDLLSWRAILLGHFIGQRMDEYARTHRFEGDRWLNWREGKGSSGISEFVSRLSDQHFQLLLTCRELNGLLDFPYHQRDESWLTLPADDDLTAVAGALQVENTPDRTDWEELLGKIPNHIRPGNFLRAAWLAAERTWQIERIERLHTTHEITSEVKDQLESIIAFQVPALDLLEHIVKNTDRMSTPRAEEMLKSTLGSVYNGLCYEAQYVLMAAEQVFHYPGYASPGNVIFNIAKAFEVQFKRVVLPLLRDYLAKRGVHDFPRRVGRQRDLIIRTGRIEETRTLGDIGNALSCRDSELTGFCREHGLSLPKLQETIRQVRQYRNETGHEETLALPEVAQLRDKWLGVGAKDGGIFRLVVTDRFDPRLVRYRPERQN